jgi:hypothetical protein
MNPLETMKTLTFGVEFETVNLNRRQLAEAVVSVTGGSVEFEGGGYDRHVVVTPDGRKWIVVTDASLSGGRGGRCGEVVTPICTYADIETIQKVARALFAAGARVDSSCGIHVHVGALQLCANNFKPLVRLAQLVYQQEALIFEALTVAAHRRSQYCRPVPDSLIRSIAQRCPTNRDTMASAWYGYTAYHDQREHYHQSRYHGLNIHSVFFRGTVEFRYFEATLHAGKIKSYVQFCLALATKALSSTFAVARKRTFNAATAKYDFRVFLLRLGLNGDEFKSLRHHLLGNLRGSASYQNGPPPRTIGEAFDQTRQPAPSEAPLVTAPRAGSGRTPRVMRTRPRERAGQETITIVGTVDTNGTTS